MPAAVISRRKRRGVRLAAVRADARRLLAALGIDAEVSIALVGDAEMRRLNAAYRGVDRPTDVLAFSMREGKRGCPPSPLLGDVVISLDTAARQAAERGLPLGEEVLRLLAHGVLHLLGYDHERSAAEARRMFRKQREVIARLRRSAPGRRSPGLRSRSGR
jgi:probable rRNA maturation factor